MTRIVILVHRDQDFEGVGYYLRDIAAAWRAQAHEVVVVHGTDRRVPADLAILHVDLSVVPDEYLAWLADYPCTVNTAVRDISKRTISQHQVRRGDGYAGPVVVKSDRNSGGRPEWNLARRGSRWRRRMLAARRRLPWPLREDLDTSDYRVFDHPARVPWPVWHNRHFVVERFLPERDGDLYCLRTWTFLGDACTHSRSWSPEPIIKARNVVRREVLDEVPDALWRLRRELGFEYGKFDYVVHDGRVVLYDVNRTPAARRLPGSVLEPNIRILAAGLGSLLRTSP